MILKYFSRIFLISTILLPSLSFSCYFQPKADKISPDEIPTALVLQGELVSRISEVGIIKASKSFKVHAPFRGKISNLAEEGSHVQEGDTVLWMDAEEIKEKLEAESKLLISEKASLEKVEEEIESAIQLYSLEARIKKAILDISQKELEEEQTRYEKYKDLFDQGLIPYEGNDGLREAKSRYEQKKLEVTSNEAEYLKAKENYERGQKIKKAELLNFKVRSEERLRRYRKLKRNLERSVVTSPVSGVITFPKVWIMRENRKVQKGDQVHTWMQAFLEICDTSSFEIKTQIDEKLVSKISENQTVEITVEALQGITINGKVHKIDSFAIDRTESEGRGYISKKAKNISKVFPVTIFLDDMKEGLQPGMSVAVDYILWKLPDRIKIPSEAIFSSGDTSIVFVMKKEKPVERAITIGEKTDDFIEITEGLKEGESICLLDPRTLG